ncbi:nicotinate-nucleotide--dimethylbenzimidazole phosphoribosyltransferase [Streptomyces sp. 184]|uniref:nicotinate-nucleotide--dimethylbenzimidazole phosphoribosyltransferase n=1 Tax=Streptomyces sp. 184 TaxID=1827526 RepID=UPI003891DE5F
MTDTGKLPEGHQPGPDDAAGGHHSAPAAAQPGAPAPAPDPEPAPAADDDDFLFLPGAQGAWTDPRLPAAAGATADTGARSAPPAGGAEPATGGQRRPLHMGPPVPETAGGVVRSLADRGPASGSVDTREAVAAADAGASSAPGGVAPIGGAPGAGASADGGNAAGTEAGSPVPAAAGPEAAAVQRGPEGPGAVPGAGQAVQAGPQAVAADVPEQTSAAGGPVHAAAPGEGGTSAHGSLPTAVGSVPPQVAGAGGQVPQPPVRTPGPPTVGPEYLDVTRVGPAHLPGPQLGEIPPAPAGWTTVSHAADAETVAPATPREVGAEDSAGATAPEAAPARDGATVAAPVPPPSGATPEQGAFDGTTPGADGEQAAAAQAANPTAEQGAGGTHAPAPVSAGVDAAQAAVRRAAASAGASLGRGISTQDRSVTPSGGQGGAAEAQPADAAPATGGQAVNGTATPQAAAATQATVPAPAEQAQAAGTGELADGAAPHAVPAAAQSGDGAAPQAAAAAEPRETDGRPTDMQSGTDSPAQTAGRTDAAAGDQPADGGAAPAVTEGQTDDGSRPDAGEEKPADHTTPAEPPAAAQVNGHARTDRPGGAAEQPADGAVPHPVANGQPVNGTKARAANGQAVPGGQPAVPAARTAGDDAAATGPVHAAAGARRGVSLDVQTDAEPAPPATAADAAADSASEVPPEGEVTAANARAGALVTQLRARRRRGTAVSAPVTAAAAPTGDGQAAAQDAAAPGVSVPAQGPPAPQPAPADDASATPAPAAGTPAPAAAPAAATDAPAADAPAAATDTPAAAADAPAPAPADAPGDEAPADTPDAAPGFADAERAAVHRVMRERRDIRNGFRSDPVPHEVLLRVLEAAHTAPSVGHSQPWDFVVIRSEETRHRMHELAARQREAYAKSLPKGRAKQFKELKVEAIRDTPVNIVVTADPTRGGRHTLGRHTQPQMAPYSSALAVENLWLAARAEGLGVGWVSFFDERELVRELDLPEHLDVVAYLCVGYVDEFPDEPELVQAGWSKRRPLSWVVHEESYGRRALPGEDPHDLLAETLEGIRPLDAKALGEAWERQKRMTKPAGSLGVLEIIAAQLCGLSRKCPPPVPEPAAVAVFAGDHGVHAQGVTPWPQEVTGQMVANFLGAGAVCNAFAAQVGAEVCVVDAGVAAELPATAGLVPRKVRRGTADMTAGPAMTREEALRAVEVGIETARDLVAAGNKALLTGEMGIANTTASAAIIAVFTDSEPAEVTGRGTGIDDETHARKVEAVRRAIEVNRPDPSDPIGVLAAVGGLEHAALVGFILAGSALRTPVILDGVSAGAAALVARAVAPESLAACVAGHRSPEPGHAAALTKLGLRPLIDLDLRLGEGTGALLALPLVQSAARAMHDVATFDAAGVTEKG